MFDPLLHNNAKWSRAWDSLLLGLLLIATRVPFSSHYLYDIDSVNFALGMRRFDPSAHQPHPPGYFLYVLLGRLANTIFRDANTALVAISVTSSVGALLFIYALSDNWFGRNAAVFSGLIFIFSPLVWFHGTVALVYPVEAFFSAVTGYLCWRLIQGAGRLAAPLALTVGVAVGFRPSFVLFLGPLLLWAMSRERRGRILIAAGILGLTLLAWGLPMMAQSGGIAVWWSALSSLWQTAGGKQTVFNSSAANSIARMFSVAAAALLCFGFAALAAFVRSRDANGGRARTIFTLIWITPGLLFFTLVFFKFVNSGYLLVISPPIFVWLGQRATLWFASLRFSKPAGIALLALCATANTAVFLFAPVYCSHTAVRRFETELSAARRSIPQLGSAADTMIIGFDAHFMGYRHAGYYLPGWYTAQYPEVSLASGNRVFTMQEGDTHLVASLPLGRFRRFVLFPLPSDDAEYAEYVNRVRARFPPGALRRVFAGGHEFTVGSTADLGFLFPHSDTSVYSGQLHP